MIKLVLGRDQLYYVSLCEDHDSIRLAITPEEDVKVKKINYFNEQKLSSFHLTLVNQSHCV